MVSAIVLEPRRIRDPSANARAAECPPGSPIGKQEGAAGTARSTPSKRLLILAAVSVVAGCAQHAGPITSTIMLDGDEAFLPTVGDFKPSSLTNAPDGLALGPGDVLYLSQQTFAPAKVVGERYGRRAPSDLGTLRLPLRKIGLHNGPRCRGSAAPKSALSPSEQLVISTVLGNVRQTYSYQADETVEGSTPGLKWDIVNGEFRQVLERCGDGLWNTFVDSLRAHKLSGSSERVVLSVDLEDLRRVLPQTWSGSIPGDKNPNNLTPRDVFGHLFIAEYDHGKSTKNTRVELSTLNGTAYSTFGHVLDESGDQSTYGEPFATDEVRFQPRFIPRNWVVLNGVDFRSDDLDRDEMHWSLQEVENSMICVDRDSNGNPVSSTIAALRPDPKKSAIALFDDRNEANGPQPCDISMGLTTVSDKGPASRGRIHLGPRYFDYPRDPPPINPSEDFGNREACGPTWFWRLNTGAVAQASRVLSHVPVHTVSELEWHDQLASADQKPSVSERCLAK